MIVHRLTHKVTHGVVKPKDGEPRLVPVEQVADVIGNRVSLRCTKAELEAFEPFVERHVELTSHEDFHQAPIDPTGMMIGSVPMESYYVTREVERIPEDELAVSTGTKVSASDEKEIGHVAELVVDRASREVTHFVVEHGDKEVTLPLTAIDFVAEDTVNLKLDKASMEKLPWIEARPKHGAWAGANVELVGAVGGKVIDRGFSNTFLKSLAERLQPGKSGLLVVVQDDWVVPVREALAGRSGVILQHELTDRLVAELTGEAAPPS